MKKPIFVNGEIYHIYNRGVEKRHIFNDDRDRFRFIHDLYEMNNNLPVLNSRYWFVRKDNNMEVQLPYIREKMVDMLAFCLMPNHYHLLLRQTRDNGIVKFMQKLGTAYTNYFNLRNERVGSLFQGRFKAIHVNNEAHFRYLPHYIHLNPLDLHAPEWRDGKIKDPQKAFEFLSGYRWSSYPDYTGSKNFPSVLEHGFRKEVFGNSKKYAADIKEWLNTMHTNLETLNNMTLE